MRICGMNQIPGSWEEKKVEITHLWERNLATEIYTDESSFICKQDTGSET